MRTIATSGDTVWLVITNSATLTRQE
jgi:hypothetical protein